MTYKRKFTGIDRFLMYEFINEEWTGNFVCLRVLPKYFKGYGKLSSMDFHRKGVKK